MSEQKTKCPHCNADNMIISALPDGVEFFYCLNCKYAFQDTDVGFWRLAGYDNLL